MKKENFQKNYYIGLDVGTDSIGYAVTDEEYNLLKHAGEPMWGSCIFPAAEQSAERRSFRTARRRLNRRQQRIKLLQEIFAEEITKLDKEFFIRLQESSLYPEDKTTDAGYDFFKNETFDGEKYFKKYPTIHHLIFELMKDEKPHDVRLVYIACAWLLAHRGHFLSDVKKNNIDKILDFAPLYKEFEDFFINNGYSIPWNCSADKLALILKEKINISSKEKKLTNLLFDGKKPPKSPNEEFPYNISLIIKLMAGGETKLSNLFGKDEYDELPKLRLGMNDEDFITLLSALNDDSELILKLKAIYDWALLTDILKGKSCISEAKIEIYEQHNTDLQQLKYFIKKYFDKEVYRAVFRDTSSKENYVAYSGHVNKSKCKSPAGSASKEVFSEYLKKLLQNLSCEPSDVETYETMLERIKLNTFLPKQVENDNRVIPYQIYWHELNTILKNASKYLKFLNDENDGYTNAQKILSIFEFRIPYYVGPLAGNTKSKFSWIVKKAEGRIYPWNFEKMVDLDKSEQAFIDRMTNSCTYLPGENVLPKNSLLYSAFEVLNAINTIKIDGMPITVKNKKTIFNELFMLNKKVSFTKLKNFMLSNGIYIKSKDKPEAEISGIDTVGTYPFSLKSYIEFAKLREKGLNEEDIERIISRGTYSEDRFRFAKWLETEYPQINIEDRNYIASLQFSGFGRFSARLLNGITGINKESGETGTIIHFMMETNDNFMQLLSSKYTFIDEIQRKNDEYYSGHSHSVGDMLDDVYISNAVKRPIIRTIDIIKDITKTMGYTPTKIFIEMARDLNGKNKKERSVTRKVKILDLYKKIKSDDVRRLSKELDALGATADNQLQSDVLFLYFLQLGRCMYSGEQININDLKTNKYNIDHIYPQAYVKDDSILNNKVLVLSTYNGIKGDKMVPGEWQSNMIDFWRLLKHSGLINDEKFIRLTRKAPFTEEERLGFINRQLVETRQSSKALAEILKNS